WAPRRCRPGLRARAGRSRDLAVERHGTHRDVRGLTPVSPAKAGGRRAVASGPHRPRWCPAPTWCRRADHLVECGRSGDAPTPVSDLVSALPVVIWDHSPMLSVDRET